MGQAPPNLPWHALRHHAVSRAVYAGATQTELLERYGHSNIASSAIYQHADQGRDHQIANAMSQLALQQPSNTSPVLREPNSSSSAI